jgi:hypothetical protein
MRPTSTLGYHDSILRPHIGMLLTGRWYADELYIAHDNTFTVLKHNNSERSNF